MTLSSVTLPARWAVISFSIFIASITQISAPSSTSSPFFTATLRTVPWSGETSVSVGAAAGARRGGALAARRPAQPGGRPGFALAARRRRSP